MATARPYQALDYAKTFIKYEPLERVAAAILQDASNLMWNFAPWRWTLVMISGVALPTNSAVAPILLIDPQISYVLKASATDGSTVIDLHVEPLQSEVTVSSLKGNPRYLSFSQGSGDGNSHFVIQPVPVTSPNSKTWYINATCKLPAPTITSRTMHSAGVLLMDDAWFTVYRDIVLWRAYMFADDPRAGAATWADGKVQYTGQAGIAMAALERMKASEPLITIYKDKALEERKAG